MLFASSYDIIVLKISIVRSMVFFRFLLIIIMLQFQSIATEFSVIGRWHPITSLVLNLCKLMRTFSLTLCSTPIYLTNNWLMDLVLLCDLL